MAAGEQQSLPAQPQPLFRCTCLVRIGGHAAASSITRSPTLARGESTRESWPSGESWRRLLEAQTLEGVPSIRCLGVGSQDGDPQQEAAQERRKTLRCRLRLRHLRSSNCESRNTEVPNTLCSLLLFYHRAYWTV